jgi:RNA polymerase sigma factor (sigma-70 family)
LGIPSSLSPDRAWDAFLDSFGDLLLKTAVLANRRRPNPEGAHDASMDAFSFILEKLRDHDFKRLRAFRGEDEEALVRWLAVVARRLCTDFWRHRYGRVRSSTSSLVRDTRRRLVDEVWDSKDSSDFPAGETSDPEWRLRFEERRHALEDALRALEPRDRLLLAFRFEEGLSARRIAEVMDYSTPFHVYRRLTKVLGALRERLEGMGIEDPDP